MLFFVLKEIIQVFGCYIVITMALVFIESSHLLQQIYFQRNFTQFIQYQCEH